MRGRPIAESVEVLHPIYDAEPDDQTRYRLGQQSLRPLVAIGLNPSKVTRTRSDNTVTKVRKIASHSGFDGFIVLNLCPLRSTDFKQLPAAMDGETLAQNVRVLVDTIRSASPGAVWLAWGNGIVERNYLVETALAMWAEAHTGCMPWVQIGPLTALGHPRHPSRIDYRWRLSAFNAHDYFRQLERRTTARASGIKPAVPVEQHGGGNNC